MGREILEFSDATYCLQVEPTHADWPAKHVIMYLATAHAYPPAFVPVFQSNSFFGCCRSVVAGAQRCAGLPRLRSVRLVVRRMSGRIPVLPQDVHDGKGEIEVFHPRLGLRAGRGGHPRAGGRTDHRFVFGATTRSPL